MVKNELGLTTLFHGYYIILNIRYYEVDGILVMEIWSLNAMLKYNKLLKYKLY